MELVDMLCECNFQGFERDYIVTAMKRAEVDCVNYYHDKEQGRLPEAIYYGMDAIKQVLAVRKAAVGKEIRYLSSYNPADGMKGLPFPPAVYPLRCFDFSECNEFLARLDKLEQNMAAFVRGLADITEINGSFATLVDQCDTWAAEALDLYSARRLKYNN